MNIATYLNYEITMRVQEHNNIMNILTKQRIALKNLWHVHGVMFNLQKCYLLNLQKY